MQEKKEKDTVTVYVTAFFETRGIYEDEVVLVKRDTYRSKKFRFTYYTSGDFHYSLEEAEQFIKLKFGFQ